MIRRRRGVVLVVLVAALSVLGLAMVGVLISGASEAQIAAFRVESVRAFYAAESAARVSIRLTNAGRTPPATGSELTLALAKARYVQVPSGAGDLRVDGLAGECTRRLRITMTVE